MTSAQAAGRFLDAVQPPSWFDEGAAKGNSAVTCAGTPLRPQGLASSEVHRLQARARAPRANPWAVLGLPAEQAKRLRMGGPGARGVGSIHTRSAADLRSGARQVVEGSLISRVRAARPNTLLCRDAWPREDALALAMERWRGGTLGWGRGAFRCRSTAPPASSRSGSRPADQSVPCSGAATW